MLSVCCVRLELRQTVVSLSLDRLSIRNIDTGRCKRTSIRVLESLGGGAATVVTCNVAVIVEVGKSLTQIMRKATIIVGSDVVQMRTQEKPEVYEFMNRED